ncbi:hypothetical protein RB213_003012 [Colletotrichum asianum]
MPIMAPCGYQSIPDRPMRHRATLLWLLPIGWAAHLGRTFSTYTSHLS